MLHQAFAFLSIVLAGCTMTFWESDEHTTKIPPPPAAPTAASSTTGDTASGERATVVIKEISDSGVGTQIGTLTLRDSDAGLSVTANLSDLTPGDHGFHVHQNPSCSPATKGGKMTAGEAAGPHFDPHNTGKHLGPAGSGHKGDMPILSVAADGIAMGTVVVPRLKLTEIKGRTIVIHEGGDNYSDQPKPNGGGGDRIACGVVQ